MRILTFTFFGISLAVFIQGLIFMTREPELDITSATSNSLLYEFSDTEIFIQKGEDNFIKIIKDAADQAPLDAEIVNSYVENNIDTFLGSYFVQVDDNLYRRDKTKCTKFYIGIRISIDNSVPDKLRINSLQCI